MSGAGCRRWFHVDAGGEGEGGGSVAEVVQSDGWQSGLVVRDLVRAAHRDPVGVLAPGTRVRLGYDVLAPAGGVELGRVWKRLHRVLLEELHRADKLDLSRAVIDSSHVRAARRGPKAVPARSIVAGPGPSITS
jgi:hypothetical protein